MNQYVYLAKLKAKGYAVESPDEQRDSQELHSTTENAGQGPASVSEI
jgi:hypothetical protein